MLEVAVELAEARIAIALGMGVAILLPEHRQIDGRALHLAHQRCPVRFDMAAKARLRAGAGEQPLLDHLVGDLVAQWPAEAGGRRPHQIVLNRAAGDAELAGDRPIARRRRKV